MSIMPKLRAILLLSTALLFAACGGGDGGDGGESVDASSAPQRILAMAPSAAEVLHVLDLDDRVVGVGDYVNWPPALAAKPRLGGLFNPDFERIVTLQPELAVLLESEASLAERLEAVGVEVLMVPSDTLGDVEIAIGRIAEAAGVSERGEAFLRQWRQDLAPEVLDESLSVALVIGREPQKLGDLLIAGSGTFYHQLLAKVGGRNVFHDAGTPYPQVGVEEILVRDPDVVVEIQPLEVLEHREEALRQDWAEFDRLAGREPRCVQVVDGEKVMVPGPRLPEVMLELREALARCVEPLV